MDKMTITEALAEVKLIEKKIESNNTFVNANCSRQDHVADPHKEGSGELVKRELQSIHDLGERRVRIREAISAANLKTKLKIEKVERTVTGWLTWRREVANKEQGIIQSLANRAQGLFENAQSNPQLYREKDGEEPKLSKLVLNVSIVELNETARAIQETLGVLDGKLSLLNATTVVAI